MFRGATCVRRGQSIRATAFNYVRAPPAKRIMPPKPPHFRRPTNSGAESNRARNISWAQVARVLRSASPAGRRRRDEEATFAAADRKASRQSCHKSF